MIIDKIVPPELLSGRDRKTPLLLAFSGGADSSALFDWLVRGGYNFEVAHVNHGIRGEEALRDEEFCRKKAEDAKVCFNLLRADIPAEAKKAGASIEETARRIRYSFFAEIMRKKAIPVLLTAHNADDNAETLIISLVRGCSPSGACGIPPVRELEYGIAVRPFLKVSKSEVLEYCSENGVDYVTDSTNSDTVYLRNSVRANIIPLLKELNPALLEALDRFCNAQREESAYLDSEAERIVTEFGGLPDIEPLRSIPVPIIKRLLLIAARSAGASPETVHLDAMLDMIDGKRGGVSLPGNITVRIAGRKIAFCPDCRKPKNERELYPECGEKEILEGENRLLGTLGVVVCRELTKDCAQIYNLSTFAIINLDRIKGRLRLTARRQGDEYLLRGMHRKLRKLMREKWQGLPAEERALIPVLRDDDGIVWAPGLAPADGKEYMGKGTPFIIGYDIGI